MSGAQKLTSAQSSSNRTVAIRYECAKGRLGAGWDGLLVSRFWAIFCTDGVQLGSHRDVLFAGGKSKLEIEVQVQLVLELSVHQPRYIY